MRARPFLLAFLLLAGCGQADNSESEERNWPKTSFAASDEASDVAAPPAMVRGPEIGVTAAPGVAFNYRYAFRLPNTAIGPVQEQHAALCERLGIARCRITGLRFRFLNEHDVEARLSLKLRPEDARAFGRAGVAAVERAKGRLVDAEIGGEDVGAQIVDTKRSDDTAREEVARAEGEARNAALTRDARSAAAQRAAELRAQRSGTAATQRERQAALAETPMLFTYGSGEVIPNIEARGPIREALQTAGNGLIGGVAFMIVLLGTLLPWALLAGVLVLIWRWARRQLMARVTAREAVPDV